jgi:hypothetical protein
LTGTLPGWRPHHPLALLQDPATLRARCAAILLAVQGDVSPSFKVDLSRLPALADRVAALTLRRYPDLRVPIHSRWRQFEAGAVDRKAELDTLLAGRSVAEQARARFDLTVVSVLLGTSVGPRWHYTEAASGQAHGGSDGLAVASFRAFVAGTFSSSATDPLRADARALQRIDASVLRQLLVTGADNPVAGLEARAALLSRLGALLHAEAARSGVEPRPGLLYDRLGARATVSATEILGEVLRLPVPIRSAGSLVQGLPAGDVWPHRWAGAAAGGGRSDRTTGGWVPFHQFGQWLSYSLVEPLQWAGVQVTGLEALTGLPDERHGGLLIDGGVIVPRNPRLLGKNWKLQDEFIVEWRALTVALLDPLAVLVRQRLHRSADELPLADILEGGTGAAGSEIARELRADGAPPLRIDSEGGSS